MVQEVFEQLKKAEKQTHDYWKSALWLADTMATQFDWIWGSASSSLKTIPNDRKKITNSGGLHFNYDDFRWLRNSAIEIRNADSNPLNFNHLKLNSSKSISIEEFLLVCIKRWSHRFFSFPNFDFIFVFYFFIELIYQKLKFIICGLI